MFKNELKFISDLNLNKLQELGQKFTIKDIQNSRIHPSLIKYINAAIDLELLEDKIKLQDFSKFDYSGDRIGNYFGLIAKEIKRVKLFDYNFISTIMKKGIIFNANYLTKPYQTLTKLLFSDVSVRQTDEIVILLSHAYYYRYLQKILLTYFDKKKLLSISYEEFSILLQRIDSISKNTHLTDTVETAVSSIANFFDPNLDVTEKVPLEAVRLFLNEKDLPEFIDKLNKKYGGENNSLQLASEIKNVLRSVIPESEIIIEDEAVAVEEEFVETNDLNDHNEIEEEVYEVNEKTEEISEISEIKEENSQVVKEVEEDHAIIENQDILSENLNESENQEEIIEEKETDVQNLNELVEDQSTENDFIQDEVEVFESISDSNDSIIVEREKPDAKSLVRDLIDLNPHYDSLLSATIAFDEIDISGELNTDLIHIPGEDTNYQIDISSLSEEINIIPVENDESINNQEESENNLLDEQTQSHADNVEFNSNDEELLLGDNFDKELGEEDKFEISDRIDEIVNDDKYKEEFENLVSESDDRNLPVEETQDLENVIDEEKLKLLEDDDNEITEVFTDLTFLDANENTANVVDESLETIENIEENNPDNVDEVENEQNVEDLETDDSYSTFMAMLNDRDMTSIIEAVFDYDMEDYHGLLENINNSTNHEEAINITQKYLEENHIDSNLKDVLDFKNMISNYFSQTTT